MKGTYLGEFEEIVLLAVAILYDQAYGLAIKKELEKQTGRTISIGAVHAACNRMQDKNFLEASYSEATSKRGGKRKKLYKVTVEGQKALTAARELRDRMWSQVSGSAFQSNFLT